MTKILAFLFIFLYLIPFMTALCCFFPKLRHVCFACMVYFTSNDKSINICPDPNWTGSAFGFAFTAVSLFGLPLLLSMIFSFRFKIRVFPPGSFFYFLYYLAILISGVNAEYMIPWGFEVCKMFWMYITFLTVFNYLNNCKDISFLFYVVNSVIMILLIVGFDQKYRLGGFQIASTFPHQNSLSLYLELFGLLTLGVLMNERMGRILFLFTMAAFCGSVLLIIFTYSRGGLVVYFGGIAIVCALSILFNGFSIRRLLLMLVGLIILLCIMGYALPRIILRFTKAPEASKNTRIEFALAAKMMANDHRLGVGANNYSVHSAEYWNRVKEDPVEHGGIVETVYLLVAAECGWWGLGVMLLWFLYYYFSVTISMFSLRKMPCSGIAIGIFAGLTCNYWHSTLEWSLKQTNNFAGLMIIYALTGVIAVNRKNIKAAYRKRMAREGLTPQKKKKRRVYRPVMPTPPDFDLRALRKGLEPAPADGPAFASAEETAITAAQTGEIAPAKAAETQASATMEEFEIAPAEAPAPDTPAAPQEESAPAPDTPASDTPAPDTPASDTPAPDTPAPDTPPAE